MSLAIADRALNARATALMVMLSASWGMQQVAIKLAIVDLGPITQSALRSAIATAAIIAWCIARGTIPSFDRSRMPAGILAGVLFGVEFTLIYWGVSLTTASRAALFIYTAPFFVVFIGWWVLPNERLGLFQMGGVVLAFAGVAVALWQRAESAPPSAVFGDCLILAGAALWAATTLIVKASNLREASVEEVTLYQIGIGAALSTAAALFANEHSSWPSLETALLLGYQSLWVATITFLIWFGLVARYSANLLSTYTFLTPLFGVAAGHFLLGEPISKGFAAACALVLLGLVIVNRPSSQSHSQVREG